MPKSVVINGVIHTYTYADGRKLKTNERNYVGSIIYEGDNLKRILIDGGNYYFYFNDHLGNVRTVANASGTAVQRDHYYPFGLPMAETASAEQDKQPYKYNGKEFERANGLNLYDYGARHYDAALGRFTTMDRFAEKYYSLSPYQYAANNPIRNLDVNGDSIWFSYKRNEQEDIIGITMHMTGKVYNDSGQNINMKKAIFTISSSVRNAFKGSINDDIGFSTDIQLTQANSMNDVESSDHLFVLTDKFVHTELGEISGASNYRGGKVAFFDADYFKGPFDETWGFRAEAGRTAAHEVGHLTGLDHTKSNPFNLMRQGGWFNYVSENQLNEIYSNWQSGKLNLGRNYEFNMRGKKRPNRGDSSPWLYQ